MSEVVVITGASRGIGHATALKFAAGGATVIGTSRTATGAAAIESAGADLPGHVRGVQLDLAGRSGDDAFQSAVSALTDRVDVLICNAGVMIDAESVKEQSVDEWD